MHRERYANAPDMLRPNAQSTMLSWQRKTHVVTGFSWASEQRLRNAQSKKKKKKKKKTDCLLLHLRPLPSPIPIQDSQPRI
jgi:hypothetical protein